MNSISPKQSSTCSIEEFQIKIQELINYPLRSHVISFIRSFLPGFQVELAQIARVSKQNLAQLVKHNELLFLEINSSNSLVDLDELLFTTTSSSSAGSHQHKRRFSPDFLIDSENLNLTPSGKRFHSLQHRSTASPPTSKLAGNSATGNGSINQALAAVVGQQATNISTSKASMSNNSSVTSTAMNCALTASGLNSSGLNSANLTNPSILHNHLTQARQAMLEELMANRYYQSPIQQQFNLINQHLNQQIAHGSNPKLIKQQNSLLQHVNSGSLSGGNHLNGSNLNSNLNSISSQLNSAGGSGIGSQLTNSIGNQLNNQLGSQLSGHLQANLLVNNPLNLNKQLERLALLERYEKEIALQQAKQQQSNLNDLRSSLEANALGVAPKMRTNSSGLPLTNLAQQQGQLINGLNLSASSGAPSSHQLTHQSAGHHHRVAEQPMNEEEFKNIETMLNCIINMVEKTKKALNILQQKNQQQSENQTRHEQANSPTVDWARAKMPLKTLPIKNLNNIAGQSARSLPLKSVTPPIISLDSDYIDMRKSKDQLFSSLNIVNNPVPKMPLNRSNAQTGKRARIFPCCFCDFRQ